ncbi:hypothetical protein AAY473_028307 [Plecturocebus cupreus]
MHFEDGRDRATSEGLLPCRVFLPMSTGGAVAISSGCVGEGGVHACPPPSTVFLAFRVTLQGHSAKSVCCSLSSASWVCAKLSWGPFVSPEFGFPNTSIECSVIDFAPPPLSPNTQLSESGLVLTTWKMVIGTDTALCRSSLYPSAPTDQHIPRLGIHINENSHMKGKPIFISGEDLSPGLFPGIATWMLTTSGAGVGRFQKRLKRMEAFSLPGMPRATFPSSVPAHSEAMLAVALFFITIRAGVRWHDLNCCNFRLPGSSNSLASASRVAGITVETGFHHVGQACLEHLTSDDPPVLASQKSLLPRLEWNGKMLAHYKLHLLGSIEMGFHHIGQAGFKLLTSGDLPTLASQSAGIADMSHVTRPGSILTYVPEAQATGFKAVACPEQYNKVIIKPCLWKVELGPTSWPPHPFLHPFPPVEGWCWNGKHLQTASGIQ